MFRDSRFEREALESLVVLAGVMLFGLFWRSIEGFSREGWASAGPQEYLVIAMDSPEKPAVGDGVPDQLPEASLPEASKWLVDGFNVLHAGLLHGRDRSLWWTEPQRRRLLAWVGGFRAADAEIWVVFDGARSPETNQDTGSRIRTVFAASADDWMVKTVRADSDPSRLAVVTADRQVAGRARHHGAQVVSPRAFLTFCEEPTAADDGLPL